MQVEICLTYLCPYFYGRAGLWSIIIILRIQKHVMIRMYDGYPHRIFIPLAVSESWLKYTLKRSFKVIINSSWVFTPGAWLRLTRFLFRLYNNAIVMFKTIILYFGGLIASLPSSGRQAGDDESGWWLLWSWCWYFILHSLSWSVFFIKSSPPPPTSSLIVRNDCQFWILLPLLK